MFKTENDDIIINDAMRWMVKENSMEETKSVSYPDQKRGDVPINAQADGRIT